MEEALGSWRQKGRVSLWRYRTVRERYQGWHFSADEEGCSSLLSLLDILSVARFPAHRTLAITDPTSFEADRIFGAHDLKLDVPAKLRIGNDLQGGGAAEFSGGIFSMLLTSEDISRFSGAVKDVSVGHADFGERFGGGGALVNFW